MVFPFAETFALRPGLKLGTIALLVGEVRVMLGSLPLGTRGEVVPEVVQGVLRTVDVPAMRGVGDKLSAAHNIGGEFGRRTELGAGLSHGGAIATLVLDRPERRNAFTQGADRALQFVARAERPQELDPLRVGSHRPKPPEYGFPQHLGEISQGGGQVEAADGVGEGEGAEM